MIVKLTDGRILEALPYGAETAALVFEIGGYLHATGYAHALADMKRCAELEVQHDHAR